MLGRSYGGPVLRNSTGLFGDDSGVDELPTNGVAESVSLNDLNRFNTGWICRNPLWSRSRFHSCCGWRRYGRTPCLETANLGIRRGVVGQRAPLGNPLGDPNSCHFSGPTLPYGRSMGID